jgi:hypothetical protein
VLERFSLVIDRGQSAGLNVGCGSAPSTFADGAAVGGDPDAPAGTTAPAINGLPVPAGTAGRKATKKLSAAARRARNLAACNKKAAKVKSAKRRKAAKSSCAKRFGKKPAAAKKKKPA